MSLLRKVIDGVLNDRTQARRADLYRNLIRHEAKIGGQVFGPVPAGRKREFFCLDEHTWVWHEEWKDENGQTQIKTTRYDVRPSGVIKSQNGHYQSLSDTEAQRLRQAAIAYVERVNEQLYAGVA